MPGGAQSWVEPPAQKDELPEIRHDGAGFTVNALLQTDVQPPASVTVTVYVPLADAAMHCDDEPLLHW